MNVLAWLRRMLGKAPDARNRLLALRQRDALGEARQLLPNDPVIEREWSRLEEMVRQSGLRE